jgi:hypothetical protein
LYSLPAAVAAEVGHTLGLLHDGQVATSTTAAVAYSSGQGKWAPIMVSTQRNLIQTLQNPQQQQALLF